MNKFLNTTILALAVLAVLSYGNFANAQNATSTNYRHDRDHFFPGIGVRAHLGLGGLLRSPITVVSPSTSAAVVTTPSTTVTATPIIHRDFNRFHDFARLHNDHFLFLNGQYVVLPQCPAGTQLSATGECVIVNQVLVQQAAPTILQEQIQVPTATVDQSAIVQGQTSVIGQPVITCPAGSTQVGNQCQVTTTSTQTVAPNISCAVGTLVNGQCVEQQQQIVVGQSCGCPAGSVANGAGQCVVTALPSQVTVGTTAGEIIVLGHHFHHEGSLPWLR